MYLQTVPSWFRWRSFDNREGVPIRVGDVAGNRLAFVAGPEFHIDARAVVRRFGYDGHNHSAVASGFVCHYVADTRHHDVTSQRALASESDHLVSPRGHPTDSARGHERDPTSHTRVNQARHTHRQCQHSGGVAAAPSHSASATSAAHTRRVAASGRCGHTLGRARGVPANRAGLTLLTSVTP